MQARPGEGPGPSGLNSLEEEGAPWLLGTAAALTVISRPGPSSPAPGSSVPTTGHHRGLAPFLGVGGGMAHSPSPALGLGPLDPP